MVSFTTHFAAATAQNPEPLFPSGPPRWLSQQSSHPSAASGFFGVGVGGGPSADSSSVIEDVEELKKHGRAAVAIELTTIPMYLYAMWSIRDDGAPASDARKHISGSQYTS